MQFMELNMTISGKSKVPRVPRFLLWPYSPGKKRGTWNPRKNFKHNFLPMISHDDVRKKQFTFKNTIIVWTVIQLKRSNGRSKYNSTVDAFIVFQYGDKYDYVRTNLGSAGSAFFTLPYSPGKKRGTWKPRNLYKEL